MMKPSASSYYTSDDEDDYNDYGTGTLAPSPENFESERINKKPSDIQKINLSHNSSNASGVHETISNNNKVNNSQLLHSSTRSTNTNLNLENSDSNSSLNKFPKLLFSSPSATVTSNGPSVSYFSIKFFLFTEDIRNGDL